MKRMFSAIFLSMMLSLTLVPATVQIESGRALVASSVAFAAPACEGGVELSVGINNATDKTVCPDANGGVIVAYLKMILKFLSGGVGVVILLMLIIAGVQYITAAGQPEQVKAAKTRIQNALTGLVLFLIAFAVLNFIIPGGIFG